MIVYHNGSETKFFDLKTQTIIKPNSLKDIKQSHMVQAGDDIFFFGAGTEYIKYSISQKKTTKFNSCVYQRGTMYSACYYKEKNRIYILHRYTDHYSKSSQIEIIDPINLSVQVKTVSISHITNPQILASNGLVYIVDTSYIHTMSDNCQITSTIGLYNFQMKLCAIGDGHIYIFTTQSTIERFDLESKSFTTVPDINQLFRYPNNSTISKIVYVPSSGVSSSKLYCFSASSTTVKVYDLITYMFTDVVIEVSNHAVFIKRNKD
ncbi:hypothetical protein PPL_03592 [Heterostelium album PN500]|uniref:Uncharacterized protein n=1 Tax=Heterostelium pallidum (strain ATCC 26659 / Pp 5 / PN500) TaxID=670386 RepID=D3B579_HETP5|nr:hypothetical protein PPL_03592 [Heterostelium album PN500]EFA83444.1 hypothetical protein PPL_03592 [Heterostelium album PN500]|eukprot:XP_020435561.1 hypothetical protein PPL_03592 [Heterostelium album PN500]